MRTAETDHWRSTPETAGWLRGRIENILDAAKASKHIASPWENPALWRGNLIQPTPSQEISGSASSANALRAFAGVHGLVANATSICCSCA
jgi:hypothetical protein